MVETLFETLSDINECYNQSKSVLKHNTHQIRIRILKRKPGMLCVTPSGEYNRVLISKMVSNATTLTRRLSNPGYVNELYLAKSFLGQQYVKYVYMNIMHIKGQPRNYCKF